MIVSTLTGSSNSKLNIVSNTSVDVECTDVYSIFPGQVVYIGQSADEMYTVNISTNANEIVRYCNILKLNVKVTDHVAEGQLLGSCDNYVSVEYCTTYKNGSVYPVRINTTRYYKQNPVDVITGKYAISEGANTEFRSTCPNITTELVGEIQRSEFGDNR